MLTLFKNIAVGKRILSLKCAVGNSILFKVDLMTPSQCHLGVMWKLMILTC